MLVCVCCQDAAPSSFSSGDVLIPLADEYDPMFPNDYEKVVKRHREERQRQREQERQKEIEEREKYAASVAPPPHARNTLTPHSHQYLRVCGVCTVLVHLYSECTLRERPFTPHTCSARQHRGGPVQLPRCLLEIETSSAFLCMRACAP